MSTGREVFSASYLERVLHGLADVSADDLVATVPTRTQPGRWRHVENGPQARPHLVGLPGGRPRGVAR